MRPRVVDRRNYFNNRRFSHPDIIFCFFDRNYSVIFYVKCLLAGSQSKIELSRFSTVKNRNKISIKYIVQLI